MLPEIAAEVLHFMTRRDLDKACVVNKQFNRLIELYCDVYSLRLVFRVELFPSVSEFKLIVFIEGNKDSRTEHTLGGMDEAAHFIASVLRHSCVDRLELRDSGFSRSVTFFPNHWAMIVDAIRSGAVRSLVFNCVDFSALDDDVFMDAVGCPGLQSLQVQWSVVPSGYVTDALIRSSIEKGLLNLNVCYKNKRDAPHGLSDDVVLDFFFRADAAPEGQPRSLCLKRPGVTASFVSKFFEHLLSSPLRPSGCLEFYGEQTHWRSETSGLSAYAQYLAPRGRSLHDTYRFPPIGDDNLFGCPYEVIFDKDYRDELRMRFHIGSRCP